MPIIGLALAAQRKYESKLDPDRGKPEATKFLIGTLDSRIVGHIRDMGTKFLVDTRASAAETEEAEVSLSKGEMDFATVQFGLRGWENFKDTDGNDIPFKTRVKAVAGKSYQIVEDGLLRQLPADVIADLAGEIIGRNVPTDEQGNASG